MATATRTSDRPGDLRFDLAISQEDADDLLRSSPYFDDLDDYHFDPERLGHVYAISGGRAVLVAVGGELICIDPEDLD